MRESVAQTNQTNLSVDGGSVISSLSAQVPPGSSRFLSVLKEVNDCCSWETSIAVSFLSVCFSLNSNMSSLKLSVMSSAVIYLADYCGLVVLRTVAPSICTCLQSRVVLDPVWAQCGSQSRKILHHVQLVPAAAASLQPPTFLLTRKRHHEPGLTRPVLTGHNMDPCSSYPVNY